MYFDVIVIGIMIGWLLKGQLRRLGDLPIKGAWLIILLGVMVVFIKFTQSPERRLLYQGLMLSFFVIMIYMLVLNRKLPGVKLIMAGLCLNFLVMAVNGGRMPVSEWAEIVSGQAAYLPELLNDTGSRHVLLTDQTKLFFLGDIIPIPPPYPVSRVISAGDVFLILGVIQMIVTGMKKGLNPKLLQDNYHRISN